MDVLTPIRADPRLGELAGRLERSAAGPVVVDGLWGSCAPILAALLAERSGRPLLYVTAHADEADDARDDIETAVAVAPQLLPQLESLTADADADEEIAAERLRLTLETAELAAATGGQDVRPTLGGGQHAPTLGGGQHAGSAFFVVAPIQALMQPVPSPAAIAATAQQVAVGQTLDPDRLAEWLSESGFGRCDQVEVPGDFARRGGIVDVFSPAQRDPLRIEFFGDQVESIRFFDAGTQRSAQAVDAVRIPARTLRGPTQGADGARRPRRTDETTSFLAILPRDTVVIFHEPLEIQELGRTYWQRLGERTGLIPADAIFRSANQFTQVHLRRFAGGEANSVSLDVGGLPQFEPKTVDALHALNELAADHNVIVLCDNPPEAQRFREVLDEADAGKLADSETRAGEPAQNGAPPANSAIGNPQATIHPQSANPNSQSARLTKRRASGKRAAPHALPAAATESKIEIRKSKITTAVGVIHRGFTWRSPAGHRTAFVPHHELFHRYRQRRTLRRVAPARPIDSFFDLNAGDYVVHALHGIGRFRGLHTLEKTDRRDEFLVIEFADAATVHVPVSQVHVVQKYIGSVRGKPTLSKLGGSAWKRTKERVAEAVTDMAAELLAIQAQRQTQPGIAYPQDTAWQHEFEGSFLYQETEDQLRALGEIKTDMTRPRPMDRLLCGDVGFGKTELAIRAAFKTVEFGKQVAVLVPTTVLAEQHFHTFRERLADYPFTVEALSRFKNRPEQNKIIERTRKGQVDILIGTHRLLSNDVRFSDLGLVVIDEEQRFGVEAKERLKKLRATVDVLTLSATPIPRTLHMAMLGMRDISSLATPPVDRRAIVTQVRMWDDALIREAILRELNREGQAYVVHNFVRDIEQIANRIRTLAPEARVVVGHGQMSGPELEAVMLQFLNREADVLVSTNIIESGIDIASANTMFINRAERFGLADLHQLRGRVGRSKHRAYCYLLLSPKHPIQETAARRLKAIEHYADLGAGFQIAMRDLEIRGAGNILGPEQSGNIEAVGYEMYCQLLEQATRRLRNEPAETWRPVNLDLGITAVIPKAYIRSEKQRMEVYKRLASARSTGDVQTLEGDLRDAYGPLPDDVQTLLLLAEIRALASPWGVRSIVLKEPDLIFAVDDMQQVQALFASGPGSPRMPDAHTVHWRLSKRFLELPTLLTILRRQLAQTAAPPEAIRA